MKRLGSVLSRNLTTTRSHYLFKETLLINDWESIVGNDLANKFSPLKIQRSGDKKSLLIAASSSLSAMAKYLEPMLLDKINIFFGRKYIDFIYTTQMHSVVSKSKKTKTNINYINSTPSNLDEALEALKNSISLKRSEM